MKIQYLFIIYKNWNNLLNLYIHFLFFSWFLREGILKIPGIKSIPKGYSKDEPKLISVSLIRWSWVFLYMAQKHDK